MHTEGVALWDVWMDMVVDPSERLPVEVVDRILRLSQSDQRDKVLFLLPDHQPSFDRWLTSYQPSIQSFDPLSWKKSESSVQKRNVPDGMLDQLQRARCLDALKAIPSETIDLAFADPPFNLTKTYNGYSDDLRDSDYIGWCKRWLVEYERVLKPGGSMFLLNLPKWSVWLVDFLSRSRSLYLQNWIAWNSLPEPKGVVMPAHYCLLYLTKTEQASRFNYCSMENGWEPFDEAVFPPDRADVCRRRSCIRRRRASAHLWRGELTDIWHDIHRQRLASRWPEAGKSHPCQTPERLIDRIVRLATNPGDIVLDAFAGIGTTAMIASRLGRRFIAIEQDNIYIKNAESRIEKLKSPIIYTRNASKRRGISKRALQIELRRLALMLGRLPTRADVEQQSKFNLELFDAAFASWSAALKAAKITISSASGSSIENNVLWPLTLDSESASESDSRIN
jgi:site-specific DNA-methyltransferase (adenine-specific)